MMQFIYIQKNRLLLSLVLLVGMNFRTKRPIKNLPLKPFGLAKRAFSTLSNSSKNSTSVVLWGSNLSSTLGFRFSNQLRNMVSLPLYINSIIVRIIQFRHPITKLPLLAISLILHYPFFLKSFVLRI
jgi:hypothetical protein